MDDHYSASLTRLPFRLDGLHPTQGFTSCLVDDKSEHVGAWSQPVPVPHVH